ncbi:hypothetical protein KAK05_03500 [Candidatus Parcubacteria bacterium]|nr:hypothetical protein [Candidatus Parcubacteria bacterium]
MQQKPEIFESVLGTEDRFSPSPGAEDQLRILPIVIGLEDDFDVDLLEELTIRGVKSSTNFLSDGSLYEMLNM